ncbi:MAG: hypothetical protein ACTHJQ_00300 [Rhizobiaceae bacterium]
MRRVARVVSQPRTRTAQTATFAAPIAGWIANRALSLPESGPQGASALQNWFPTATGCILRRGSQPYAETPDDSPVLSLFKYVVGNNKKFFCATGTTVYDITTVNSPLNITLGSVQEEYEIGEDGEYAIGEFSLTSDKVVWDGAPGGKWYTVQFATTGGIFLVGVNGSSVGFIFDGAAFYPNVAGGVYALSYDAGTVDFTKGSTVTGGTSAATATILDIVPSGTAGEGALLLTGITGTFQNNETITDADGGSATAASDPTNVVPGTDFGSLTSANMAFVWVYKNSLWFIEKESLSAWYMPVDQIGGTASQFPMGGEFGQGGSLLIGQSWSLNASGQGGLSEQNVFVSTVGEVVVYQGTSPDEASTWGKVGTYQIGRPMGRSAFIRAGGDLVFATSIGAVALSTAVQVDIAALAPKAVSFAIEDEWNAAVAQRGFDDWICCLWTEGQMMAVAPPAGENEPMFLVSNARTGAWAPFTNWNAICMEVFEGQLYFGTPDGLVMNAMVSGTDNGVPFTGTYIPLFSDEGRPTQMKTALIARAESISVAAVKEGMFCRFDFDTSIPEAPPAAPVSVGSEWDNGVWDESLWNSNRPQSVSKQRYSVGGNGYRIAPGYQVTSGAVVPIDTRIVTVDVTYEAGDDFT